MHQIGRSRFSSDLMQLFVRSRAVSVLLKPAKEEDFEANAFKASILRESFKSLSMSSCKLSVSTEAYKGQFTAMNIKKATLIAAIVAI